MKKYVVSFNSTTKKFQQKDMQRVGSCTAKNKAEAIEKVYAASQGKDNDAYFYPQFVGVKRSALVAEIEK